MPNLQPQSRRAIYMLAGLTFFALLIRLVIAVTYRNDFDTGWYLQWANGLQDGFFDAYAESRAAAMDLDYPPLWLYPLYLVGLFMKTPILADFWPYRMFFIKFFPILFDCLIIPLIYQFALKKLRSPQKAMILAGFWALNPSAIYNCAFWGQTDGVMIFFLLLCLWYFDEDRPAAGCIAFAVGALIKLQFMYLFPVILFLLIRMARRKQKPMLILKGLGAGLGAGLFVFLPFMIGSGNWLLPFSVYFGGMGRYPYLNLNAANLYGLFPASNWAGDNLSIIGGTLSEEGFYVGGFTFSTLSWIVLILSVALIAYYLLKHRKFRPFHGALLLSQLIFMMTTRQHERYQMGALGLSLAVYILSDLNNRYFLLFSGLTVTTFFNQFFVLSYFHGSTDPWAAAQPILLSIVSALNLFLFALTIYLMVDDWHGERRLDTALKSPEGRLGAKGSDTQ